MNINKINSQHLDSEPTVTAVVLCYNTGIYAIEALESILKSKYMNLQIICIDDASNDGSQEKLKKFFKKNKIGKLILNKENLGIPKNLNIALKLTEGEFFFALGDDSIFPDKILKDVNLFKKLPKNVAVVHSLHQCVDMNGEFVEIPKRRIRKTNKSFNQLIKSGGGISAPTAMIRTNVLKSVGGWDESIPWEDVAMWLKLAKYGHIFYLRPEISTNYRINSNSVSSLIRPGDLIGQMKIYLPYINYFQAHLQISKILIMSSNMKVKGIPDYDQCLELYQSSPYKNRLLVVVLKSKVFLFLAHTLKFTRDVTYKLKKLI